VEARSSPWVPIAARPPPTGGITAGQGTRAGLHVQRARASSSRRVERTTRRPRRRITSQNSESRQPTMAPSLAAEHRLPLGGVRLATASCLIASVSASAAAQPPGAQRPAPGREANAPLFCCEEPSRIRFGTRMARTAGTRPPRAGAPGAGASTGDGLRDPRVADERASERAVLVLSGTHMLPVRSSCVSQVATRRSR
jgi:hypothetical protein